jgi:hypothetical protein
LPAASVDAEHLLANTAKTYRRVSRIALLTTATVSAVFAGALLLAPTALAAPVAAMLAFAMGVGSGQLTGRIAARRLGRSLAALQAGDEGEGGGASDVRLDVA